MHKYIFYDVWYRQAEPFYLLLHRLQLIAYMHAVCTIAVLVHHANDDSEIRE